MVLVLVIASSLAARTVPSRDIHGTMLPPASLAIAFAAPSAGVLPGSECREVKRCSSRKQQQRPQKLTRTALGMGLFDLDFEVRWEQKVPLKASSHFDLWLDVRPSTVLTIQDRRAREERLHRGDPREGAGGWSFPQEGGDSATDKAELDAAEEAARIMKRLYEEMRGAGPLLKKCCPDAPVQGLVFDYRNTPARSVGKIPLVTVMRDGSLADVSGEAVRELRIKTRSLHRALSISSARARCVCVNDATNTTGGS